MRVSLLVFFIFLGITFSNAQVVYIPDTDFQTALVSTNCAKLNNTTLFQDVDTNNDGLIQVNEAAAVTYLDVSITTTNVVFSSMIGISAFTNMAYLNVDGQGISSFLDVSACSALQILICTSTAFSNLKANNLPNLIRVDGSNSSIDSLSFTNCPNLTSLMCENATDLNLTGCVSIRKLYCIAYNGYTLDLSNHVNLDTLDCHGPSWNLSNLLIKNGKNESVLDFSGVYNLNYICADPSQVNSVKQKAITYNMPNVNVDFLCNYPVLGGNSNTISGRCVYDGNTNGCTANDSAYSLLMLQSIKGIDTSYVGTTNYTGAYTQSLYATGTYTLKPLFPNPTYFTSSPSSVNFTVNNINNIPNQDFCITANGVFPDVEAIISPLNAALPGDYPDYLVHIHNKGTSIASGIVTLNYPGNKMLLNGLPISAVSTTSNQTTWPYNNLPPNQSLDFYIQGELFSSPINNIGDELQFDVNVSLNNDVKPNDNSFLVKQKVVSSYLFNEKRCLEDTLLSSTRIGDYLHYVIRFRNANATNWAENVLVIDSLDVNKYDISSIEIMQTSAKASMQIHQGVAQFYFDDVYLLDVNSAGLFTEMNGYILYKIKTKSTLPLNSVVTNKAQIYFDYNSSSAGIPAVIASTNVAKTTFSASLCQVSLSANMATICNGEAVLLSVNGGSNGATYSWQYLNTSNGSWVNIAGYSGTSSASYTANNLSASTSYRVIYNTICGTGTTTSLTISVVAKPILTTNSNNFCAGNYALLTVNITGISSPVSYQWQEKINNVWTSIGINASTMSVSPSVTTSYRVITTQSTLACIGADSITLTVKVIPAIAVSPSTPFILCSGGSVIMTASGANAYTWSPASGLNTTTGATVTANPSTNKIYTLIGTGTNGCTASLQVPVTMYNYVNPIIKGNITQVCYGTAITYFIDNPSCYTYFSNPNFQWKVNGVAIAGATNNTLISTTIHDDDVITCEINTGQSCHPLLTSNNLIAEIVESGALIVPTVSISIYNTGLPDIYLGCGNASEVTNLYVNSTFGGSSPTFLWKKNGVNVGTTNPLSTVTTASDIFTCEMTSSLTCAVKPIISKALGVVVLPNNLISGTYSCMTKEACIGDQVTYCVNDFTLRNCNVPNCGGSSYFYQNWINYQYSGLQNDPSCYSYQVVAPGTANFDEISGVNLSGPSPCNPGLAWYPATFVGAAPILHYSSFAPTISISYTNLGCGGAYLFTANSTGLGDNGTYQWKVNGVNALSGTYKQFASSSLQTGDIVTCTMTSSLSCATPSVVVSNPITINTSSTPVLSTSTPTICTGGTAQLSVTNIPSSTYSWQYFNTTSNIWLDLTGVTGLTFSQALTASRMYRVNYVTPCGSGTTPAVTVNVIPDPVVTVGSSNVNLCSGTNTTLTATLTGGTGTPIYQWQEQISGVYTNIVGATNQTYITPNLTANKNYKIVSSMSGSGCNASGTGLISLVVKALPTVIATPTSPSYCVGGTVSIAASGASIYSWSPATGLSTATGTPVIASGTSSTTYTLTGTGTNGCSKTISVPVTVNADPSISISGNNSVCSGATTTFTATNAGGSGTCSLVWQSSTNGTTWTTISGATGTTYTTPALSANAYYRATYTCTGGGCSPAAVSNSIYVTLISPTPMMLSTSTPTICTGGTAQLSLNAGTSGTTYTWQYLNTSTNVWTNISGYVGTTNTTYSAVLTASASYRVLYATSCGTGTTATVMVNVIPDPAVTVASSSNNFCAGGNTTLTATITGGTGTPSYQWQEFVANVYNNVAGATNATYTTASITANKYYKVLATMSGSGCGVTGTGVILVSVLPLPTVAVSPASPTYCVGGAVSITASGTAGNTYSWSPATNLSATTGTPVIASPQATTSYTLTGTGTNGCVKTITVPVTVTADPSISISGPNSVPTGTTANLSATVTGGSGTCTRQWQSSTNGTTWANISGATGTSYTTPAITGTKYYRASYNCTASGCSPIAYSNTLAIIGVQPPARMEMPNNELSLSLFPNPADVKIIVHLDMTKDANTEFAINNLVGEEVIKWQGQSENGSYEQEISLENLASGVYFLTAKIEGRTMIQKFVKE